MNQYRWIAQLVEFEADQSGTALTEFVITMPIVILIFAGIVTLGQLGLATGEVKAVAQKKMWEKTIKNIDKPADRHKSPRAAIAGTDGELLNVASAAVSGVKGHWGESYSRVKPVNNKLAAEGSAPGEYINGIEGETGVGKVTADPKQVIGDNGDTYAKLLVDDTMGVGDLRSKMNSRDTGTSDSGLAIGDIRDILRSLITVSGGMPFMGAGVTYGTEHGQATKSVRGYALGARYDATVAPRPVEEWRAWVTARAAAETFPNYSGLMQWQQESLHEEVYSVP